MVLSKVLPVVLVTGVLLLSAQGSPIGSSFVISYPFADYDQWDANIAYNSQQQEYLVVWWGDLGSTNLLWGQRVSCNGSLVGSPIFPAAMFDTNQYIPDVAYNSQHNEYLVVWDDRDLYPFSVSGRRVAASGWFPGEVFNVVNCNKADTYCGLPAVDYASAADRYLVIYEYGNSFGWIQYGIAARAFTSDGSPDGTAFDVRPYGSGTIITGFDLAYNRTRNEFLVVWSEVVGTTFAILGRRVKMTGGAGTVGDIFTIASTPPLDNIYPAVAALPLPAGVGQYLVAWQSVYSTSDSDIYAQRVAGDGSGLVGSPIIISNPVTDQGTPAVAGNEASGKYLVTWRHASNPPYMWLNIRGREVSSDGDLLGNEEIVGGVFAGNPAVAAGSAGDFLIAYHDTPLGASYQSIYGRLWGIRAFLPLVMR